VYPIKSQASWSGRTNNRDSGIVALRGGGGRHEGLTWAAQSLAPPLQAWHEQVDIFSARCVP